MRLTVIMHYICSLAGLGGLQRLEIATKRQHVHFSVQTTAGGRERTIEIVTN